MELDQPLGAALADRWRALAGELGIAPASLPGIDAKTTRGDFIRAAWNARAKTGTAHRQPSAQP